MATSGAYTNESRKVPQESTTEVSRRYEIDGVHDLGTNSYQHRGDGFTHYDQKDMQRMGKNQELMVSNMSCLQKWHPCILAEFTRESFDHSPPLVSQ